MALIKPEIEDEIHQTIYDLAENFQKIDDVSEIYMSSIPNSGYWMKYQKIWNTEVDIGSNIGWINIREGQSAPKWESLKSYSVNDLLVPTENNGHYYKCIQGGYSGVTEPIFPTVEGQSVEDIFGSQTWQASVDRDVNDIVVPTIPNNRFYVCVTAGTNGTTEPEWPLVDEDEVIDGDVVWKGYRICVWEESGISAHFRPFGKVD